MVHGNAGGQSQRAGIFSGSSVTTTIALDAFGRELARDLRHGQRAVDRLAAGHRDRVVVQNLVGDRHLRRQRRANRQHAGVEVGAVAKVGEHVLRFGERRLADPGHAFAAHLRKGLRRCGPSRSPCSGSRCRPARGCLPARGSTCCAGSRSRNAACAACRRAAAPARVPWLRGRRARSMMRALMWKRAMRWAMTRAMPRGRAVRRPPAAASRASAAPIPPCRRICRRRAGARPRASCRVLPSLVFDDLALFLDHQNLFEPSGEIARRLPLRAATHADLVQADADLGARRRRRCRGRPAPGARRDRTCRW